MQTYNPFTLEGKTILVTGASSGIGRGIAIVCSKMGGKIVLNGRNEKRLEETLSQMDGNVHQIIVEDLSNMSRLSDMVSSLPKLDGIAHCAGIGQTILCKQVNEMDFDQLMNINLKAPIMLQTEILKQKKVNKGASIVFISSIGSESPNIGNSIYSASKGGIISYARCLALELAPRHIRVNSIQPAMVRTEFLEKLEGIGEDEFKKDVEQYPLKRYGTPEDVAYAAVYLLSDASAWITRTEFKLTGGIRI